MSEAQNKIFKAIADPTRREIFRLLVVGSALTISQISTQFNISRQGVTKHIKLLEEAKMVKITTHGREKNITPSIIALQQIKDWLSYYDQFWDDKMDALGSFLDQNKKA